MMRLRRAVPLVMRCAAGRAQVPPKRSFSSTATSSSGTTLAQGENRFAHDLRETAKLCAEMRKTANQLLELEEWLQAQSILETLLTVEDPGSDDHRRVLSELALCKQSQMRFKEAVADYEACFEGAHGESWNGANVALMNYAELQASQDQWALAESLARKALKHKWPKEQSSLYGAAKCNLGTYLAMQHRHEQAANELEEGAKIMGRLMGRDHESVVEAAANTVRCLRAAGLVERAEQFAKEWKVADKVKPEHVFEDEEKVYEDIQNAWKHSESKKSLDPAGFLRSQGLDDDEAEKFMVHWEATGLPSSMMKDMFESMNARADEIDSALEEPAGENDSVAFTFDDNGNLVENKYTGPDPDKDNLEDFDEESSARPDGDTAIMEEAPAHARSAKPMFTMEGSDRVARSKD